MEKIIFSAGQKKIYEEGEPPVRYPQTPYEPAPILEGIPPLEVHPKFKDQDYVVTADITEYLIGITPAMLDWWWANMEKGYYLWAPGEHFGFDWIVPPCQIGYVGSVEASYEFDPLHPIVVERISMQKYPFTDCFSHCWMGSAKLAGYDTNLIHMYQAVPGGCHWRSVQFMTRKTAEEMARDKDNIPDVQAHMKYESGRFRYFLPQLYALWQGHPDPWQNMQYDLTVQKNQDGTWSHMYQNLPPR